jgi:hypothetical protein
MLWGFPRAAQRDMLEIGDLTADALVNLDREEIDIIAVVFVITDGRLSG